TTVALYDRMVRRSVFNAEYFAAMPLELCTNKCHELWRIAETERSTVQWNESLAAANKVEQCLFLRRRNHVDIGVKNQAVKPRKWVRRQPLVRIIDVLQVDIPLRKHRRNLSEPFSRPMVSVITQEQ